MQTDCFSILLIDDDELDRQSVLRQLKRCAFKYKITIGKTADEGLIQLREHNFDVVLLDFRLDHISGLEILEILNRENLLSMPIIMLSGMDDESLMLKCLEHGAQDFLLKSELSEKILSRTIRYAKERKTLQQQLLTLSKYDPLTGLTNRELFISSVTNAIRKANRQISQLAVLFIDIDHFKIINDSLGHNTGDELLKSIAQRLKDSIRAEDLVARLGGDEFAVLLDNISSMGNVAKIAVKIISNLQPAHHCYNHELTVSSSIGISTFPECGLDTETLLQAADTAMYEVKRKGRNDFQFFSENMQQTVSRRLNIENALRTAIENNELSLHYQPQVDIKTQQIVSTEALLRWKNPQLGNIAPDEFIPIAEDTGLIRKIGAWVLLNACQQTLEWSSLNVNEKPLLISINVSLVQLKSNKFLDILKETLPKISINPQHLVLEITENLQSEDLDEMVNTLQKIHDLGVLIAIDDFGTGFSSLSYLRNLPIDILKIDRSFMADIGVNVKGEAIVKTIITLGQNLGLQVIAEGIETQIQADFLLNNHCDIAQGYHFSRPLVAEKLKLYIIDSNQNFLHTEN